MPGIRSVSRYFQNFMLCNTSLVFETLHVLKNTVVNKCLNRTTEDVRDMKTHVLTSQFHSLVVFTFTLLQTIPNFQGKCFLNTERVA